MLSRASRDNGQARCHEETASDEKRTPAPAIDQAQPRERGCHHDWSLQRIEEKLRLHTRHADSLDHQGKVVARGRQLDFRKPGNANSQQGAVSSTRRVEQVAEVPETLVRTRSGDHLLHLVHFQAHNRRVGVSIAVIFDQDLPGLVVSVLGHPPTWTVSFDRPSAI